MLSAGAEHPLVFSLSSLFMKTMMRHRSYTHQTSQNQNQQNQEESLDDADMAAGLLNPTASTAAAASSSVNTTTSSSHMLSQTISAAVHLPAPPKSMNSIRSDLEFFDDLVSEPVLVLGVDISHLSRNGQFLVCASGVFMFSLLYGFLQELISVQLCNRQLGLFLAVTQFTGYTLWSFLLRTYVYEKHQRRRKQHQFKSLLPHGNSTLNSKTAAKAVVPFAMYLGLSLLRAVDLGMTNMAMQYINYPAKTLMKSSRVVFTMLFGVLVARKRYQWLDYVVVCLMVSGLGIFMHADANSSAVFDALGIIMLTISLLCDGAISNMSEAIMNQYGVGQDEFIFRMYSIALVAITGAAVIKGDMYEGIVFLSQPGRYDELHLPLSERTWSLASKMLVMALFSTMGFFGSSCSAAITKNFGALTMSITSTARKATTLFLSFALFDNECTMEHVGGIVLFVSALMLKSLRRGLCNKTKKHSRHRTSSRSSMSRESSKGELELLLEPSPHRLSHDKHVHVV